MKMAGNQRIKDAATKLREEFESAGLQVSKEVSVHERGDDRTDVESCRTRLRFLVD